MTEKFTPGPWFLINPHCVGGPIEPVWEAAGCGIAHCGMRARTEEEAHANARLIAAAPEMFEALKWFIDDIDGTRTAMLDFDANVLRARTALQKAQGEEA